MRHDKQPVADALITNFPLHYGSQGYKDVKYENWF